MREKTSSSIGLDGITSELKGIKDALYSQRGAALPPGKPIPAGAPPSTRPPAPRQPAEPRARGSAPFSADIDVADIDWRIKGNKDARDSDPFAYAFVYTNREQDTMRDSVVEVVQLCEQHGTIKTVDGFLVKLGGTDNSLLNRNIPK